MSNAQENSLRLYLLGQLPEHEQAALEAQYFAEAGRLDEIWAAENQLVDEYVRGQLSRSERAQFEQHYLTSPLHRKRVAFARQLLKTIDDTAVHAGAVTQSASRWAGLLALLRGPQWAWGAALALLLAALFVGNKLLRERTRLHNEPSAQIAQHAPPEAAAPQPTPTPQEASPTLPAPTTPPPASAPPAQPPKVFAFALSASLLRGSSAPQPLVMPRGMRQVELRMRLETGDYASYQIQLRTVEGAELLRRRQLKPRARQIAVTLPAGKLRAGDYILTLTGETGGAIEEVNRYFFRVSPK